MDIVEFLLARLDDDEAVARAAGGDEWVPTPVNGDDGPWEVHSAIRPPAGRDPREIVWYQTYEGGGTDEVGATHIARHDPARVLREVEAKRRIVDHYAELRAEVTACLGRGDEDAAPVVTEAAFAEAVGVLALPDADHPDYQPEWKP